MIYKEIEIILIEDNLDDATLAIHSLRQNKLTNKIIHLKMEMRHSVFSS